MANATEERIRACLIREGVCAEDAAERVAAVIAEEINEGDDRRVSEETFNARMAQIDASIAQLGREFAERDAERAREFTAFLAQSQELERQRDERERQRDERERERDAKWERREGEQDAKWERREREQDAKWDGRLEYFEEREDRFRRVVYAGLGVGFSVLGLLVAVLALVA